MLLSCCGFLLNVFGIKVSDPTSGLTFRALASRELHDGSDGRGGQRLGKGSLGETPFTPILEGGIHFWQMLNPEFLTYETTSPDFCPCTKVMLRGDQRLPVRKKVGQET